MRIYDSISYRMAKARRLRWQRKKRSYQAKHELGPPHHVFWIFGCQRSGTTFLENIFRQDPNSAVYGEFSELSIDEGRTSLQEPDRLVETVTGQNARYAVIRPLFESDRMEELLDLFPSSSAIWLYRDCDAVVRSMQRKWDDRFFTISKEVEQDGNGMWRLEGMAERIMQSHSRTEDRYAAYWKERNQLILEPFKERSDRILLLDYDDFIKDPYGIVAKEVMKRTATEVHIPEAPRFKVKERKNTLQPIDLEAALRNEVDQLHAALRKLAP